MIELRCKKCRKKHAEADMRDGRVEWVCQRCSVFNVYEIKGYSSYKVEMLAETLDKPF